MKDISKYPELSDYLTNLGKLVDKLSQNTADVTADMVNDVVNRMKTIHIDEITTQAISGLSLTAAKDEGERQDNVHQAERILNLCRILVDSRLVSTTDTKQWKNIGIKAGFNA